MDNIRNHNDDVELCLVCCSKVESSKEKENLLLKNLLVIFLLKNVMQVVNEQLEENLRNYGNPLDWIRLCKECCQLARKALDLHCQVVKIDRELWAVQQLIVEKTKSSNSSLPVGHRNNVWRRTRAVVKNSNFQSGSLPVNPFIEGDKLATANYYFRQNLCSNQDNSRSNEEDDGKLVNFLQIKTEQLNFQVISDNEGDDDDWPLDGNDNDEVNSEENCPNSINKKPNYPLRKRINGKFKCNFCSKLFYTSSGCSKHEQEKHASIPNQFPCSICGMAWNSRVYLQRHMARKHKVRLDGNQLAKLKSKGDQDEMFNENGQNSDGVPIPATPTVKAEPLNDESDSNAIDVDEEGNLKDDDVEWQLDDENCQDLSDEDVEKEMEKEMASNAIKSVIKPAREGPRLRINGKIKCYYCDQVFSKTSGCSRHENEKHAEIPGLFPCDICGKAWNSKECLTSHRRKVHKVGLKNDKDPHQPKIIKNQLASNTDVDTEDEEDSDVIADNEGNMSTKRIRTMRQTKFKKLVRKKFRMRINGKIKCYYCDKLFARTTGCYRHENEKHAKIPAQFRCQICGKAWNSREYLSSHIKKTHKTKSPQIKKKGMNKFGKSEGPPIKFKWRERVNGKIKCNYCDKLFCSTPGVYYHEKEKHAEIPGQFRCDICDKAWNSKIHLSKHLTRSHGIESTKKKEFYPTIDSESSSITSDPEIPFDANQVDIDSQLNSTPELGQDDIDDGNRKDDDLQLDDVRSAGEGEVEADVQNKMKKAMGLVLLKTSSSSLTNGKGKRLACKFCNMTFRDRFGLGRHERAHKNEKRRKQMSEQSNKSDWFDKRQRGSSKLEWVDGKVKCSKCDKLLTTAVGLRNHETYHKYQELISKREGENVTDQTTSGFLFKRKRKFEWVDGKLKCGNCDREFCTERGLLQHEREKHMSEEGGFICELCGKTCLTLYKLKCHKKRVHLLKFDGTPYMPKNYKPKKTRVDREDYGLPTKDGKGKRGINYLRVDGKLKCNYCDRLFISPDGLGKHEREKHPKRPGEFVCTHCGLAFNSKDYLIKHTERKHWMRLDGTQKIPPWVATRKYKWKRSEK